EKLLVFYDPYISKCCLRPLYDEYGNVYIVVDMELKGRIREALPFGKDNVTIKSIILIDTINSITVTFLLFSKLYTPILIYLY
ncbi:helix-turn-helix domain-containing protein, partial [Clostridioides difficile]|uniref:helix-turn-helix domain-containing protein n=1 Tax=Clostridioides difficile TaxID=1496 RepID=UPI003F8CF7B4